MSIYGDHAHYINDMADRVHEANARARLSEMSEQERAAMLQALGG